jgi:hypothetical protein
MTRASRGISDIQEHARGNKMKKDMAPRTSKTKVKVAKKRPMAPGMGDMSVGSARSGNLKNIPGMGGMKAGMKSGGSCKGYAKGGAIDGVAHKGKTKGKIC